MTKNKHAWLLVASLVSLVAFRAEGDIMPLLGYGGALFPMVQKSIVMNSATVVITTDGPVFDAPCPERTHYDCAFELESKATKKLKLKVGFPVPEVRVTVGEGASAKYLDGIENFVAEVDGVPVKIKFKKKVKISADSKDEVPLVRAWPMSIDPGQKIAVHVAYDATTYCYTMYPPNAVGVKYILRTGALWEGPIGKLDLEIRFRDYVDESTFDDYQRSHIKKELGFELGEFSGSGVDTILAWHLENIEPTGDLNLACIAGSSIRAQKRWEASEKVDAVNSGKDARDLRDLILATFGMVFDDKERADRFAKEPWYMPNPDFSLEKTPGEPFGAVLKKLEARIAEFDATTPPADVETQPAAEPADMVDPDASTAGATAGPKNMEIGKRSACACALVR